MKAITLALMTAGLMLSGNTFAFDLTSQDIQEGHPMEKTFEFSGWGCSGNNLSPQLSWDNAPKAPRVSPLQLTTQMRRPKVAFGIGLQSIFLLTSVSYLEGQISASWVV